MTSVKFERKAAGIEPAPTPACLRGNSCLCTKQMEKNWFILGGRIVYITVDVLHVQC